jgi:hypothetical protein
MSVSDMVLPAPGVCVSIRITIAQPWGTFKVLNRLEFQPK